MAQATIDSCRLALQSSTQRRFLTLVAVVIGSAMTAAAEQPSRTGESGYPRKELLVEVTELANAAPTGKRVILDTREKDKYAAGHIPGAAWIDAAAWGKAVSDDQDPENWTRRFTELGIDDDSEIIVYDDQRLRGAARVWWILRLWGIRHARVLNGGWNAYAESASPVEKELVQPSKRGTVVAKRESKVLATKDLLLTAHRSNRLGKAGEGYLQVIDTRSTAEFCGTDTSRAKKVGTIPGAKHLEWSDLLVPDSSRVKSAEDLQKLFAKAQIDVKQPAATFCQGGGRAAVMAFGLELMGSPEARNYYASWGEWGNADDTPVETPESQ